MEPVRINSAFQEGYSKDPSSAGDSKIPEAADAFAFDGDLKQEIAALRDERAKLEAKIRELKARDGALIWNREERETPVRKIEFCEKPASLQVDNDALIVREPVLSEERHNTYKYSRNFYTKIPLGEGRILVVPHDEHNEPRMPGIFDCARGLIGVADTLAFSAIDPTNNSMAVQLRRSPDGALYAFSGNSSRLCTYDSNFNPLGSTDLSTFNPDFAMIRDFLSTEKANYVCLSPSDPHAPRRYLVALDKKNNTPLWTRKFESTRHYSLDRGPDGAIYTLMEKKDSPEVTLFAFSPSGLRKKAIAVEYDLREKAFQNADTMIYSALGHPGGFHVTALDTSGSSHPAEKWTIHDEQFEKMQFTSDRKSLYAADRNLSSLHGQGVAKIDASSGKILWRSTTPDEKLIDYRIIDDQAHILKANEDGTRVTMMVLNPEGRMIWEKSLDAEIDLAREGLTPCVTGKGEFIFGAADGNLYLVRPRKTGETEETLKKPYEENGAVKLLITKQLLLRDLAEEKSKMKKEQDDIEESTIDRVLDSDDFIIIDGLRLDKK